MKICLHFELYFQTQYNFFMRNIKDLLQGINIGIAVGLALSENKENTLELYKNIMNNSILPTKELTNNYTKFLKEHANEEFQNENFNTAVLEYLDIFENVDMDPDEYKNTAICLIKLNQKDAAIEFLKKYEECLLLLSKLPTDAEINIIHKEILLRRAKQEQQQEIFQYYIIDDNGAEILQTWTNEIVYYIEYLDIYIWGVTHYGTSWDYVLTNIKIEKDGGENE